MLPQKGGVLCSCVVLLEESADNEAAVPVVRANGQGLVNDLLRIPKRRSRPDDHAFDVLNIKKRQLRRRLSHSFGVLLELFLLNGGIKQRSGEGFFHRFFVLGFG